MTISNIPTFIVPKTLAEFKAFYKAVRIFSNRTFINLLQLKLRFANIQWPEFPGTFRIFNRKFQKKQILNKILQNICEVAKLRDKDKKALLGIFYAFFLDPRKIFFRILSIFIAYYIPHKYTTFIIILLFLTLCYRDNQ